MFLRNGSTLSKYLNYITFVISASFYLLFKLNKKYDKIFIFQVSPVFSAIPAIIYSKIHKTKIYLWVLDLWPESIYVFGFKSKIFFLIIKKISDLIYLRCDILFAQSKSLVKILKKRYKKKTILIPNWSEEVCEKKVNTKLQKKLNKCVNKNKINIFFGGNIGKAQDFDSIIKAVELINKQTNKFDWYIFGEGSEKFRIQNYILSKNNLKNIYFFHSIPQNELLYVFKKYSDFLLVSLLKSKTLKWTIPGKIQFYLQCKKPIIGMLDGEANSLISKSDSGFVVNSGNYVSFSRLLMKLTNLNKKDYLKKKKLGGYNYSKKFFNKKDIIRELKFYLLK